MRLGIDTGGTFTDVVAEDGRVVKVLSTPGRPGQGVLDGIGAVGVKRAALLAHGTTVATNALLERRGATVALVTNRGMADVIEIGRQDRPSLYDQLSDRPEPLVRRDLRFEIGGRLGADGKELEPLELEALPQVPEEAGAISVCLLHSDLNPVHERRVADALAATGKEVVASHQVSPEFREYERTVTTVVDAHLRQVTRSHLRGLAEAADEIVAMSSAGGLVSLEEAMARPAALLLSGPAAGVRAAAAVAAAAGFGDAVSFDMGGTSTDVALISGGVPEPAAQRTVAGLPVRLPALDVHTIGAGGGSIARIDPGGALMVGPRSAGADPGPACYGRGGSAPTVTDADLVLGRIPEGTRFPGIGPLDHGAARAALARAGVEPDGVTAVVDAAMAQAVRVVTVERGVDPRGLALVAFGGAGPIHACALADALGMAAVVIPPRAGVLSAVGLLGSPRQAVLVRSWPAPGDHGARLTEAGADLAMKASRMLAGGNVEVELALDCRYAGQSHELTVPSLADFEEEHRRRNGFARPGAPVEVTALRATARLPPPLDLEELPSPSNRRPVDGPAVLAEEDCTVWVARGWSAEVAEGGSWILRRSKS